MAHLDLHRHGRIANQIAEHGSEYENAQCAMRNVGRPSSSFVAIDPEIRGSLIQENNARPDAQAHAGTLEIHIKMGIHFVADPRRETVLSRDYVGIVSGCPAGPAGWEGGRESSPSLSLTQIFTILMIASDQQTCIRVKQ